MAILFDEFSSEISCAWLSGKDSYWLIFRSQIRQETIIVSWYSKGMPKVEDYFININKPTSEEITMFALEFGDKLADMLFHNEKEVVFRIYD